MQSIHVLNESSIERTARVMQVEGMFDLTPSDKRIFELIIDNVDLSGEWNIGLIVGSSGSGKSSVARKYFSDKVISGFDWDPKKAIIDGFPEEMSTKDVIMLLSMAGFSSPPYWLTPFHLLSNGEQFRVTIARALAENSDLFVMDEFTSVIDRNVAQISSHTIQKIVRQRKSKFIALSCHYDIIEWLQPDWIIDTSLASFERRFLWRRPPVNLEIRKVHYSLFNIFKKYHYLSSDINKTATCFAAFINNKPVAFHAWLPAYGRSLLRAKRGHRTVCLPDYQGLGIGYALIRTTASAWASLGYRVFGVTAHPAEIRSRIKSGDWHVIKLNKFSRPDSDKRIKRSVTRAVSTFEWIGPKMELEDAEKLINAKVDSSVSFA